MLTYTQMRDAENAVQISYDDYLDYLLHETGLAADGYSSVEEWAELVIETSEDPIDFDDVIEFLVEDLGADSWEEYSTSDYAQEDLDRKLEGRFDETINYFEIKLNVSEYKNGHWLATRSSENFILSDQKNSALTLLDGAAHPTTTDDFHLYSTTDGDIVTVQCLQTHHTSANPYIEGEFQYNVLSKSIIAIDHKDDRRDRSIDKPTGTDLTANRFIEKGRQFFEIPLVEGAWYLTSYQTLLERTPGTFKVPLQHQYEQFTAEDDFFYGDDKRSYLVSTVLDVEKYEYSPSTFFKRHSNTARLQLFTTRLHLHRQAISRRLSKPDQ